MKKYFRILQGMMSNSQTTCEIAVMNKLCWSKIYGTHHTSLLTLHRHTIEENLKICLDRTEMKKQCRKTLTGNVIFFSTGEICLVYVQLLC